MSHKKPPHVVQPGPCPVIDGVPVCPPPTEIDIIKVKKVFQECMHTQVEEVQIEFPLVNATTDLTAECVSVVVLEEDCEILAAGNLVKVTATLAVTSRLNGMEETEEFSIEKTFRLARAGEPGLSAQCHVFPECLFCFVSDQHEEDEEAVIVVTCCVGIMILIKLEAEVQLLVPTYGYPAPPPECDQVLGVCPDDFEPQWPPYPPQDRPPIGGGGGGKPGKGCRDC